MSDIFNFADTWNNAGTTFNGIGINVSNGASGAPVHAAASRVLSCKRNGTERVALDIDGGYYSRPSAARNLFTWLGDDVDPDTGNFYFTVSQNTGVNEPASSRANVVYRFGYNVASGGGLVDPTEPNLAIVFETYYHQDGTAVESSVEWHLSSFDTGGVEHRPITLRAPRDGASTESRPTMNLGVDELILANYAGSARVQWQHWRDSGNRTEIYYTAPNGSAHYYDVNGLAVGRQKNAALSDYISLPFINSRNAVELPTYTEIQALSVNATYGGVLSVILSTGTLATDQAAFFFSGAAATGASVRAWHSSISTTGKVAFNNYNLGGGTAAFEAWCATSGGDPCSIYNINGGGVWTAGLDNSDSDAYVISANYGLGTNNRLRIDANTVGFPTLPPKITPVAVASLPAAATVGAGTKHVVNNHNGAVIFGTAPTAGGSVVVPVYSDGTNWLMG